MPGVIYDANKATVWQDLTQLDRYAVENFFAGYGRGDYTPWTAVDAGGSPVPEGEAAKIIARFRQMNPQAAFYRETQSEALTALQRGGFWPRLWQGAGGAVRVAGTRVAPKLIPAVGAGVLLWEVGCAAGVSLPLCHHAKVVLAPTFTSDVVFDFTGPAGRCVAGKDQATVPASSGTPCPDHVISSLQGGNGPVPTAFIPPNTLLVMFRTSSDQPYNPGANCVQLPGYDWDRTQFGYFDNGGCTEVIPANASSFTRLTTGASTTTLEQYHTDLGGSQYKVHLIAGSHQYFIDVSTAVTSTTLDGAQQGTDGTWGDPPSKLTSDMPPHPQPGAPATSIGDALALLPNLRKELVAVLNAQQPETAPNWTATDVTVGPADGALPMVFCYGLQLAACQSSYTSAGFTGTVTTTVTQPLQADLTQPAGAVIAQDPLGGSLVLTTGGLATVTNPDAANMPRLVPAPGAGETYQAYLTRLQQLGLVGTVVTLTDATMDPSLGPDVVVSVSPTTGTKVLQGTSVKVTVNPTTAPDLGVPDTWTAPALHAINLEPLKSITVGCNTFPFGVFCWLNNTLGGWSATGSCPAFTVPIHGDGLVFDFCTFAPAMAIIRPTITILAALSMAWFFAAAAMGLGGSSTED